MKPQQIIVTHHAPDLDAIGSVWILQKFDSQNYAEAKYAFVNPGERLTQHQAEELNSDLHHVTHVDTGLGRFDHHQPERSSQQICAAKLVYDYVCQQKPALQENQALKAMVDFITEIDHFQEIHWPDANNYRYVFMLHELIEGHEIARPNNDESQLKFGLECLEYAYFAMKQVIDANDIIRNKGIQFTIKQGPCIGIATSNDEIIRQAQKQGYVLAVRKDPQQENIRIKARPDSSLDLKPLYKKVTEIDSEATWFYHASGKMLLNGSSKHHNQIASQLSLNKMIKLIKETYE